MPLRFRKHKDNHGERQSNQRHVEPPEITPTDVSCHGAGNDWRDHERSHVDHPVECVPLATIVEEENIGNNSGLDSFSRTSADTIKTEGGVTKANTRRKGGGFPYTQAPMKLPYVCALALQMAEPRQMS
jgi:hypothetical protein